MKVRIEQVNRYELFVDGIPIGEFKRGEPWNGMSEFTGPRGVIIVNDDSSFSDTFSRLFGVDSRGKSMEAEVVKASPDLLAAVIKLTKEKDSE